MPISRSRANKTTDDNHRSADPDNQGEQGSLIWEIANLLRTIFSHKGAFWLGVCIALISFLCNTWFYFLLLLNSAGWGPWQSAAVGLLISSFTTLFEIIPVVWAVGYQNRLHQIFQEASKPTLLPTLSKKITNADDLMKAYRNSDRETRDFFRAMRYLAMAVEVFVGVIFMGAIGTGLRAVLGLALFVASIFGTEWGVSMALRAANWELPPAIRKQFEELISHAGKALNLKNVE